MEKKDRKWTKKLIAVIAVIAVIAIAVTGIKGYMASRSVVVTTADIMSTIDSLKGYILVLAIIIILAAAVSIAVMKLKKPIKSLIRGEAVIAVILGSTIIINMVCMGPQFSLINNLLREQYNISDETKLASEKLVENIAGEGMVLLKNEDNVLPLTGTNKLNVFGWASTNPVYGGTGSGSVDESTCITLLQGLENAGYELNSSISDYYVSYRTDRPTVTMGGQDWTIPEPTIEEYEEAGIFDNAKEFSDTAIVVISRIGGENADLPTNIKDTNTFVEDSNSPFGGSGITYTTNADDVDPEKSYLELSNRETAMVKRVTKEFSKVIVVVNSSNAMELGWLDQYDSIKGAIWCAGPGQTGFGALGKIMNGSINPSGKLVDTFVYDLHAIPAIHYIGDFRYDNMEDTINTGSSTDLYASFNNYVEGIYVGYKYYETAAAEGFIDYNSTVQYPFGYGLSYAQFDQKLLDIQDDGTDITVIVDVTNTGSVAGKEVAEVYYTPPYTNGGIEKSEVNLIGFEKTKELAPGESETVTITFSREDMASYDYAELKAAGGAYILEAGNYKISLRSDSHTLIDSETVEVKEDIIYSEKEDGARSSDQVVATNLFTAAAGDVTYLSRADKFANYDKATAAPENFTMSEKDKADFYCQATYDASKTDDSSLPMPVTGAKNGLTIQDMTGLAYDDTKWNELLDQLEVTEMNALIATGGYSSAKVDSISLPATVECDGPAAIKSNYTGQSGTAFPAATMIAATWSKDLAKQRGEMMGLQCEDMNVAGWYGPAMNIHRTPFYGRNFEYYSEDGVLSGHMGANEILGASKYGIQTYMKHFVLNDSEVNRKNMLCTWTNEQAMREIYLKPFEMSVKIGEAHAAMTSFNYIGTMWAGASEELLQNVLRDEWGFVGVTVSDWFLGSSDGYMLADSAVRAGGDKMLSSQGDPKAYVTNTDKGATVSAMRNASHNILYGIANSNAMDERNFVTENWVKAFIGVDVAIGILLLLSQVYLVMNYRKKKK